MNTDRRIRRLGAWEPNAGRRSGYDGGWAGMGRGGSDERTDGTDGLTGDGCLVYFACMYLDLPGRRVRPTTEHIE